MSDSGSVIKMVDTIKFHTKLADSLRQFKGDVIDNIILDLYNECMENGIKVTISQNVKEKDINVYLAVDNKAAIKDKKEININSRGKDNIKILHIFILQLSLLRASNLRGNGLSVIHSFQQNYEKLREKFKSDRSGFTRMEEIDFRKMIIRYDNSIINNPNAIVIIVASMLIIELHCNRKLPKVKDILNNNELFYRMRSSYRFFMYKFNNQHIL